MYRCAECHRRLGARTSCPHDGWTPVPTRSDAPSAPLVAHFTLGERLGAGGFADVWAAIRERDGAPSAVKVARAAAPLIRERFRREADALERIGAPAVPALHAHGAL